MLVEVCQSVSQQLPQAFLVRGCCWGLGALCSTCETVLPYQGLIPVVMRILVSGKENRRCFAVLEGFCPVVRRVVRVLIIQRQSNVVS